MTKFRYFFILTFNLINHFHFPITKTEADTEQNTTFFFLLHLFLTNLSHKLSPVFSLPFFFVSLTQSTETPCDEPIRFSCGEKAFRFSNSLFLKRSNHNPKATQLL